MPFKVHNKMSRRSCFVTGCPHPVSTKVPAVWDSHYYNVQDYAVAGQCAICEKNLCDAHTVTNVHVDDATDLCTEYHLCLHCYRTQEYRMYGFLLAIVSLFSGFYILS